MTRGEVGDLAALIEHDLHELASLSAGRHGVTRLAWSDELRAANAWLCDRFERQGLVVELDEAGNVFGKWPVGGGRAVLAGSHLDTVPSGGRYDGALGVVGALHAVGLLQARGFQPRRPIWVVSWADEEGVSFGAPLFGSRAFVGDDLVGLAARPDQRHLALRDALAAFGLDVDRLAAARRVDRIHSYLELHVELGPILERERIGVGAVTGAVGVAEYEAVFRGVANHAGTTPMDLRQDALVAAARLVLAARDQAVARPGMTATVGRIEVEPAATNAIAGVARVSIDVRTLSPTDFAAIPKLVTDLVHEAARQERVDVELVERSLLAPVDFDETIVELIAEAAASEGATCIRMATGGGHDAVTLSRHVPAGMILVPSREGVGHSPDEHTSREDCAAGTRVLARCLSTLSRAA